MLRDSSLEAMEERTAEGDGIVAQASPGLGRGERRAGPQNGHVGKTLSQHRVRVNPRWQGALGEGPP